MNYTEIRKLLLKVFIGFLSMTALVAILSVLSRKFGETQLKVLVTTFSITAGSICAMACAGFIERKGAKAVGIVGILAASVAVPLVIIGVWRDIHANEYWKITVTSMDDAIVVVENTHRHMEMGKSAKDAASDAVTEVALPMLVITITVFLVFLPIAFFTGIIKFLFVPLALTVAYAMMASYVVALTVAPVSIAWLFRKGGHGTPGHRHRLKAGLSPGGIGSICSIHLSSGTLWRCAGVSATRLS